MRHPAGESITVTREGTPTGDNDDAGNPIIGPPDESTVVDVALEPIMAEETPGVWSVTGYRLYCPYGTEFLQDDRLTIRGVAGWQVEGDTAAAGWRSPFDGVGRGVVLMARRAG